MLVLDCFSQCYDLGNCLDHGFCPTAASERETAAAREAIRLEKEFQEVIEKKHESYRQDCDDLEHRIIQKMVKAEYKVAELTRELDKLVISAKPEPEPKSVLSTFKKTIEHIYYYVQFLFTRLYWSLIFNALYHNTERPIPAMLLAFINPPAPHFLFYGYYRL